MQRLPEHRYRREELLGECDESGDRATVPLDIGERQVVSERRVGLDFFEIVERKVPKSVREPLIRHISFEADGKLALMRG